MTIEKIARAAWKPMEEAYEMFPWENEKAYAHWAAQTYYYVCHSTRLLSLAAAHFSLTHQAPHLRCIDHMREEKSHELLALNDLKTLGYKPSDFIELPSTCALYQSVYYNIQHISPWAFFGYIICLEGFASIKAKYAFDRVASFYTGKVNRFLRVHSMEDGDHLEKAFSQIENASIKDKAAIIRCLEQSCKFYSDMMGDIMKIESSNQRSVAC